MGDIELNYGNVRFGAEFSILYHAKPGIKFEEQGIGHNMFCHNSSHHLEKVFG